jgi:hypothetical protein
VAAVLEVSTKAAYQWRRRMNGKLFHRTLSLQTVSVLLRRMGISQTLTRERQ